MSSVEWPLSEVSCPGSPLAGVLHVTCDGSGGRGGGWAWHEAVSGAFAAGGSPRSEHANSTYLEARAVRRAVEDLAPTAVVLHVYTDCQAVADAFTALLAGRQVPSRDAWQRELHAAVSAVRAHAGAVVVHWVRGHGSHAGNRVCDRLANWARRRALSGVCLDVREARAMVSQVLRDVASAHPLPAAA